MVSILSRMARVNSWVVDTPPMSGVRVLLWGCQYKFLGDLLVWSLGLTPRQ